MTTPFADVFLPSSGERMRLLVGDLIGRSQSATVTLADPFVSVAHAMVDYRGGELVLLALRKGFGVEGRDTHTTAVRLEPRMTIRFSPQTVMVIESVTLPPTVPVVLAGGDELDLLVATTGTLMRSAPHIRPGLHPGGVGQIWTDGERVMLRSGGAAIELVPDLPITVDELLVELRDRPRKGGRHETLRETVIDVVIERDLLRINAADTSLIVPPGVQTALLRVLVDNAGPLEVLDAATRVWEDTWGDTLAEITAAQRDLDAARLRLGRPGGMTAEAHERAVRDVASRRDAAEKQAKQAVYREVYRINLPVVRASGQPLLGCVGNLVRWAGSVRLILGARPPA